MGGVVATATSLQGLQFQISTLPHMLEGISFMMPRVHELRAYEQTNLHMSFNLELEYVAPEQPWLQNYIK